jgi:hypothetical protein
MARARATLDAYVTGKRVAVRFPPSKNVKADLALLDAPIDEIWEFRCTSAKPQIRVFGRFAERDLFIALIMRNKHQCSTNEDYGYVKSECKRNWNYFFHAYRPHSGMHQDDYVSECVPVGG